MDGDDFGYLTLSNQHDEQQPEEPIIENIVRKPRRSSLFGQLVVYSVPKKIKKTEYEEQLRNEIKEWNNVLKEKSNELSKLSSEEIYINKSIVSPKSMDYLKKRVSLNFFVKQSKEFVEKAEYYLSERERAIENKENFIKSCKEFLQETSDEILDLAI